MTRLRIGKSCLTFSTLYGTVFCIVSPLTVPVRFSRKARGDLDVCVAVVLFGATRSGGLLLSFGYEAVATTTGQVVAWEVELEAATHFCLDIVDFRVA